MSRAEAGFLQFSGSIRAADGPFPLTGAHGVTVSPDGRDVYVASFDDNAVVVLARNLASGRLSYTEAHVDDESDALGIFRAVAVTVTPDGKDVYVASFFGDAIAGLRRDAVTGKLTYVGAQFGGAAGTVGLTQLQGVAVSPDGSNVYVASYGDNAVSLLRRDASSGQLTFVEALIEGQGDVHGIFRASGVVVSPDGANVYVLGGGSNGIATFARDAVSGRLTFVESSFDGVGGVSGLLNGVALAVSDDAADIYAVGDNGMAHFRRGLDTGRLTFAKNQTEGVLNSEGTSSPAGVVVSPDGQHVFVAREGDDTLSVFTRHATDGSLDFLESHTDGVGGVVGLAGATTVAVGPNNDSVYVASQFGDAVATFAAVTSMCAGDCNGDGEVTVDELVRAVSIALGEQASSGCVAADTNADGSVTIEEIIAAVNKALNGCG
ncbi:MAG: beta-propeller fold lactonase family protein [Deltaproteobacteria bacterium]|nr:beta-propeller fold lactonase family protein [Deltaproteobacteria bacterium]